MSYQETPWEFDDCDMPTCPFCEHTIAEWWELDLSDSDSKMVECSKCKKEFAVRRNDCPRFDTAPTEDELL